MERQIPMAAIKEKHVFRDALRLRWERLSCRWCKFRAAINKEYPRRKLITFP